MRCLERMDISRRPEPGEVAGVTRRHTVTRWGLPLLHHRLTWIHGWEERWNSTWMAYSSKLLVKHSSGTRPPGSSRHQSLPCASRVRTAHACPALPFFQLFLKKHSTTQPDRIPPYIHIHRARTFTTLRDYSYNIHNPSLRHTSHMSMHIPRMRHPR